MMPGRRMETAAFVAATVSKAWEPLSLAISQHNEHSYPFLATMVLCEMAKLAATIVALLTFTRERWMPLLLARSTVSAFAIPAVGLAFCNQGFAYSMRRLGPMTYQVIYKAASISATACVAKILLPHRQLGALQWCTLVMLVAGATLCSHSPAEIAKPGDVLAAPTLEHGWWQGIAAVLCNALLFAIQGVCFEGAAEKAPGGPLLHASAVALYGLGVNAVLLVAMHPQWLLESAWAAYLASRPHLALLRGIETTDVVSALSIAAADLTMALFFSLLGANAYSFSRVLALVVSALIAQLGLGLELSFEFICGAVVVSLSGLVYHEHVRVAHYLGLCMHADPDVKTQAGREKVHLIGTAGVT